jgi:hypothetical protein
MQTLRDNGITVVSMDDFPAWRRGEKGIPQKPAIITLDVDTFQGTKWRGRFSKNSAIPLPCSFTRTT